MTIRQFIRENRGDIDVVICKELGRFDTPISDDERRLWILNNETLYLWARSKGVRI